MPKLLLSQTDKPFFILAPMDEVTETVFRQIVDSCAPPDFTFTEFVNVDGLQSAGRTALLKKLAFTAAETHLIAQLWGLQPENFQKTAAQIADGTIAHELGLPDGCNFVGVDLNMGCPAKSEVANGACSALILNRPLAHDIIEATKAGLAGRLPISVKTRIGFNEIDLGWTEFLLNHTLTMLTVHGRTRREMSKVPAHWDVIGQVVKQRDTVAPETLIVGNGDVMTRQAGLALAQQYGVDGIMIGRGALQSPYVFAKESTTWDQMTKDDRLGLFLRHVQLFEEQWQNGGRPLKTLNKFAKLYIHGFDGAKELREQCMEQTTAAGLTTLLRHAQSATMLV